MHQQFCLTSQSDLSFNFFVGTISSSHEVFKYLDFESAMDEKFQFCVSMYSAMLCQYPTSVIIIVITLASNGAICVRRVYV